MHRCTHDNRYFHRIRTYPSCQQKKEERKKDRKEDMHKFETEFRKVLMYVHVDFAEYFMQVCCYVQVNYQLTILYNHEQCTLQIFCLISLSIFFAVILSLISSAKWQSSSSQSKQQNELRIDLCAFYSITCSLLDVLAFTIIRCFTLFFRRWAFQFLETWISPSLEFFP